MKRSNTAVASSAKDRSLQHTASSSRRLLPATSSAHQPRRLWLWLRYRISLPLLTGIVVLVVWQIGTDLWAQAYVARPSGVFRAIPTVLTNHLFLSDAGATVTAVLEGLVIGVVLGTIVGLAIGRLIDLRRILGMYVNIAYALPIVAIIPLLTVWFGYTPTTRFVVVIIQAMLPVVYNVADATRSIPPMYTEVGRIFHAEWWRIWLGIALPASIPHIFAGIDLAIGRALIGAVVTEFLTGISGLGYYILANVNTFKEDRAVVALLTLAVVAVLLRGLVKFVSRRTLRWYSAIQA